MCPHDHPFKLSGNRFPSLLLTCAPTTFHFNFLEICYPSLLLTWAITTFHFNCLELVLSIITPYMCPHDHPFKLSENRFIHHYSLHWATTTFHYNCLELVLSIITPYMCPHDLPLQLSGNRSFHNYYLYSSQAIAPACTASRFHIDPRSNASTHIYAM